MIKSQVHLGLNLPWEEEVTKSIFFLKLGARDKSKQNTNDGLFWPSQKRSSSIWWRSSKKTGRRQDIHHCHSHFEHHSGGSSQGKLAKRDKAFRSYTELKLNLVANDTTVYTESQKNPKMKLNIPFIRIPRRMKQNKSKTVKYAERRLRMKDSMHALGKHGTKKDCFLQICWHIAYNSYTSPTLGVHTLKKWS